ncbi:MAG: DUF167 domain-containing protein [Candidatus Melainabacteria bacterium]|nr:DUF167 domain-containing protein [Candidatus Melainabacteria bacterium]
MADSSMTNSGYAQVVEDGLVLRLYVQPGAKANSLVGIKETGEGLRLKIKLKARAIEGQANAALVELLADLLRLPKAAVNLHSGSTARLKTIHLRGQGPELLSKIRQLVTSD